MAIARRPRRKAAAPRRKRRANGQFAPSARKPRRKNPDGAGHGHASTAATASRCDICSRKAVEHIQGMNFCLNHARLVTDGMPVVHDRTGRIGVVEAINIGGRRKALFMHPGDDIGDVMVNFTGRGMSEGVPIGELSPAARGQWTWAALENQRATGRPAMELLDRRAKR